LKNILNAVFARLDRFGLHPNYLTVIGALIQCGSLPFYFQGDFFSGGIILLIGALFDLLDGFYARNTGQTSAFGAFLDSTLDRIGDAAPLSGLIGYYFWSDRVFPGFITLGVLITGFLISYIKARAENLIPECRVGLAQRGERVGLLIYVSLLGEVFTGLLFLLGLQLFTVLQRTLHTLNQTQENAVQNRGWWTVFQVDIRRNTPVYAFLVFFIAGSVALKAVLG